jgi:hypothetical protein
VSPWRGGVFRSIFFHNAKISASVDLFPGRWFDLVCCGTFLSDNNFQKQQKVNEFPLFCRLGV